MKRNETKRITKAERAELRALARALSDCGVPQGGEPEIVLAFATGPELYATRLAADLDAWARFRSAFRALTGNGGDVATDETTIGALTWAYLQGRSFVEAVADRVAEAPRVLH